MDVNELDKIIEKVAIENNLDKEELTNELAEILKLKYGLTLMEKERLIIDEVKNKILTRLYNTYENRINKQESDEIKHYRLDSVEAKYLDSALAELVSEGLVQSSKLETVLTDAGIIKYKQFYGEI